jgi:hypothetical protein
MLRQMQTRDQCLQGCGRNFVQVSAQQRLFDLPYAYSDVMLSMSVDVDFAQKLVDISKAVTIITDALCSDRE